MLKSDRILCLLEHPPDLDLTLFISWVNKTSPQPLLISMTGLHLHFFPRYVTVSSPRCPVLVVRVRIKCVKSKGTASAPRLQRSFPLYEDMDTGTVSALHRVAFVLDCTVWPLQRLRLLSAEDGRCHSVSGPDGTHTSSCLYWRCLNQGLGFFYGVVVIFK